MKNKLGIIGFTHLFGLICAELLCSDLMYVIIFIALAAAAAVILALTHKRTYILIPSTLFVAALIYFCYTLIFYQPVIDLDGKTAEIYGRITDVQYYKSDTAAYTIESRIENIPVRITFFGTDNGGSRGDYIKFTGTLSTLSDNRRFSEKSFNKSRNIFLSVSPKTAAEITENNSFDPITLIYDYSNYIGERINILLPGEEGDLLNAMFLGDKSGLDDVLSDNIRRAGVSHFTAVSGLHLTVVSHIILLFLKQHRYLRFSVLTVMILLFTVFFRLSPSVIRSGIMLIIYYGAEPFMRKSSTLNSLGIAILLITLPNPYACTDAGMLLSIAGTFGIGIMVFAVCKNLKQNRFTFLKNALVSSVCAVLCTFPLTCAFFGGFSLVGIISGLLLYPLFIPALACCALFAIAGGNGDVLMFVSGLCAKAMIFVINFFGSFRYAYFALDSDFMLALIFISALFVGTVYFYFKNVKQTVKAVVLSICVILAFNVVSVFYFSDKAKIIMFSDGNGACIIAQQGGSAVAAVSDDSEKLHHDIEVYMKDNFIDRMSAIKVLSKNHNNLTAFQNLPCKIFLSPNDEKEIYTNVISLSSSSDTVLITLNGINISLSPAKEPLDSDISVIYGYTGKPKELQGIVFASSKRLYGSEYISCYSNIFYEKANYMITDQGTIRPL